MAFRSTLTLKSQIFDRSARRREFSRHVKDSARNFRERLQEKQENSPHTGRIVTRRLPTGERRRHQQSRRGERPAPFSRNLIGSIKDRKTGEFSSSVEVEAGYGEILQSRLGRAVMSSRDVAEAGKEFQQKSSEILKKML